jgi:hypothetical protein
MVAGYFTDKFGQRKILVLLGYGLTPVGQALIALAGGWPLIFLGASCPGSARACAMQSWFRPSRRKPAGAPSVSTGPPTRLAPWSDHCSAWRCSAGAGTDVDRRGRTAPAGVLADPHSRRARRPRFSHPRQGSRALAEPGAHLPHLRSKHGFRSRTFLLKHLTKRKKVSYQKNMAFDNLRERLKAVHQDAQNNSDLAAQLRADPVSTLRSRGDFSDTDLDVVHFQKITPDLCTITCIAGPSCLLFSSQ